MSMLEYLNELHATLIKINKQSWSIQGLVKSAIENIDGADAVEDAGEQEDLTLKTAKKALSSLTTIMGRL